MSLSRQSPALVLVTQTNPRENKKKPEKNKLALVRKKHQNTHLYPKLNQQAIVHL